MPPGTMETLVALGNFDGVHRGHQGVLEFALREAEASSLAPLVVTFDPHPRVVLTGTAPEILTTLAEKIDLIVGRFPAFEVRVIPFTIELSRLTPRAFAEQILVRDLGARVVLVGENFRFGAKRSGDFQGLAALGAELGFRARAVPLFSDEKGPFSSSRVRDALKSGDIAEAQAVLGRLPAFSGLVVRGDARGASLGFPTANLERIIHLMPADGVYVARAVVPGGASHAAVLHIGARPTVGRPRAVEAHLLDFEGDLYGQELRVEPVARLRGPMRFPSIDALSAQIRSDVQRAREILETA